MALSYIAVAHVTLHILLLSVRADKPCVPKSFGSNRIVCVCNSTYCDTIDKINPLPPGEYLQYTSNQDGLRFQKSTGEFKNFTSFKQSGVVIDIDSSVNYQTIVGFGGAFTDAAGINIKSLSPSTQENLLRSYFSPEGIEYNFGRVPIAGCDFSTHTYTYDDVVNDSRLEKFNLTSEDFEYKIPLIQRAKKMSEKNIHLVGAAWSAPPWMKTNDDYSGFGFLIEEYYEPWAQYHIKFLDAYKKEGLDFWCISTGNEPSNGILPVNRFNSLGWTPISQFKWVRENLGPAIRSSQHNATKIIALDDQRFSLPWWFHSLETDQQASGFVDGIGVHWYWDTIFPASILDNTHNRFPDKFILATEACVGDKPWEQKVILGSWSRGEAYMKDIIEVPPFKIAIPPIHDLSHWVVGWIDWNLALNATGGPNWAKNYVDAVIIVDPIVDEFYKQPMYYALGHFSKFVPEGSVRIGLKPKKTGGIESIAFKTPENSIVVVLHNTGRREVPVSIRDANKGFITISLSAHSFQTIVYKI